MKKMLCLILLFGHFAVRGQAPASSQKDSLGWTPKVSIGIGETYTLYTRLASFIDINVGIQGRIYYRFAERWRASFEFSQILLTSYESWEHVRQKYYDVNFHYLFIRLNKNSLYYSLIGSEPPTINLRHKKRYHKPVFLYGLWGFHADDFSATYKGDPLLTANQIAFQYTYPGTKVHFNWFGFNLGIGKEKLFKRFSLYSEFKVELNERFPDFTISVGLRR